MAKVLVISDSPSVRTELTGMLERRGYITVTCDNGHSVNDALSEHSPDVVVCDSQVRSMGVMAITREIRTVEAEGGVDLVKVLAILDRSADVFLARRAGTDAWLVKPVDPAEMRWTVDVLLDADRDWTEDALALEMAGELDEGLRVTWSVDDEEPLDPAEAAGEASDDETVSASASQSEAAAGD